MLEQNPPPAGRAPETASPPGPFGHAMFRLLWIGNVCGGLGIWMQDVAGSWLMTSLAPTPLMVALMQTSVTFPMFLLALPSGALADVIDRRRLLIITNAWSAASVAFLGIITLFDLTTPAVLLAFTFSMGIGIAASGPVLQAVVPEVVPRAILPGAIALNAAAFNIARAVGPAIGGFLVWGFGSWFVFLVNACCFLTVVVIVFRWKRPASESALPTERVLGAIRTGMRYVFHTPELHAFLVRNFLFAACGSALWALLPLFARKEIGMTSSGYGLLLGCIGAGAVCSALVIQRVRRHIEPEPLVSLSTLLLAGVLVCMAFVRVPAVLYLMMGVAGFAWLSILSTFTTGVQSSVPSWVRGRAIASYTVVFFGSMAAGAAFWGMVAGRVGIPLTVLLAAAGLVAGMSANRKYRMARTEEVDFSPSARPQEPFPSEPDHDQGPVMVTVEFRVEPSKAEDFIASMQQARRVRLRTGAIEWGLFQDLADPMRFVEFFIVESWLEHLRQHERITVADRQLFERILSFHAGPESPVPSHFLHTSAMRRQY